MSKAIYYICITVRTDESHPDFERIDQAFVGCWISAESAESAIETAKKLIVEEPWVVEEIEEAEIVTENDYANEPQMLELFKQAGEEGHALMFNVCPRHTTYFVQFDVTQEIDASDGETPRSLNADALVWVSIDAILADDPQAKGVDIMSEEFWAEGRDQRAVELATQVVENENCTIHSVIKHWPFAYRHVLSKQPELEPYVDAAEEDGISLVIWDKDKEES